MTTSHPKIGIRPIIDGRRGGIRESLEAMTMGMAQRVARLYSEELRYSDGSPVECVIADTTIGGVAEAAACMSMNHDKSSHCNRPAVPVSDQTPVMPVEFFHQLPA